jgi:peptide/nickel transport system substrate-binding protein
MGAFNVLGYKNDEMDRLLGLAAVEMDEAKRRKALEDANALLLKDRQRLPIVAVSSAWAMQKDKVTIKGRADEDTLAMNIKPAR